MNDQDQSIGVNHDYFLFNLTKFHNYPGSDIRQPMVWSNPRVYPAIAATAIVLTLLGAKAQTCRTGPDIEIRIKYFNTIFPKLLATLSELFQHKSTYVWIN